MTRATVAGVDVGGDRLHCVWLYEGGGLADAAVFGTAEAEVDRAVERLALTTVVAIDAPDRPVPEGAKPHRGVTGKFARARCAEIALGQETGIWVPWVTPMLADARSWMRVGFDLFSRLAGRTTAIEVYPHGAFTVLATGRRLARKSTPEGVRQRAQLLRSLHSDRPHLEMWSHDSLDALAAAEVALDHLGGSATRAPASAHDCGDYDGSAIWLPEPPG